MKPLLLDDYSPPHRPDAIFIWNCFEQLDNPRDIIRARRILSRHGLIVLRVPNANFYPQCHSSKALGYNNLFGFPYLNGYNFGALQRLLASSGFEVIRAFATSLLTPPYPEMTEHLLKEWDRIRTDTEARGAGKAPWSEIVGRSVLSLPSKLTA